jgi:CHAD domain-containing protein
MEAQTISEVIEKKVKKIKQLGEKVDGGFGKNNIHDFRVEIKGLRSFMRLLHSANKGIPSALPATFLGIYHISGRIREAQLDSAKIKKMKYPLPAYLEHLSGNLAGAKIEWAMHYSKEIPEKLGDTLLSYPYEDLSPEHLAEFINSRIRKIGKLIKHDVITDEELHQIRKWLKDMIYNMKLAAKEWEEGSVAVQHVLLPELEALSDSIGEYNDARILREHLAAFAVQTNSAADKAAIAKIIVEGAAGLKSERLKIIAAIRQFVNAHIAADKKV